MYTCGGGHISVPLGIYWSASPSTTPGADHACHQCALHTFHQTLPRTRYSYSIDGVVTDPYLCAARYPWGIAPTPGACASMPVRKKHACAHACAQEATASKPVHGMFQKSVRVVQKTATRQRQAVIIVHSIICQSPHPARPWPSTCRSACAGPRAIGLQDKMVPSFPGLQDISQLSWIQTQQATAGCMHNR